MTAAAELPADTTVLGPMTTPWWLVLIGGIISVIAGIVALVYPGISLVALSVIIGIALIAWGILSLARAVVWEDNPGGRAMTGLLGLLAVVGGIVSVFRPGSTTLALVLILGFWFIWTGGGELALAFAFEWHRWWHAALGLASFIVGLVVLLGPGVGVATLALTVGIGFIIRGIVEIGLAFAIRSANSLT